MRARSSRPVRGRGPDVPRVLSVLLVLTYPGSPTHGHASRMARTVRRRYPLGFVAAQVGAIVHAQLRGIVGRT